MLQKGSFNNRSQGRIHLLQTLNNAGVVYVSELSIEAPGPLVANEAERSIQAVELRELRESDDAICWAHYSYPAPHED